MTVPPRLPAPLSPRTREEFHCVVRQEVLELHTLDRTRLVVGIPLVLCWTVNVDIVHHGRLDDSIWQKEVVYASLERCDVCYVGYVHT